MFLRPSCEECKFATIPREGDFTIGDFWGLSKYNETLNDQYGTSIVLVNTRKANEMLPSLKKTAMVFEQVPVEIGIKSNRFGAKVKFHSGRKRFFEMFAYTRFNKAVKYCAENRYDVGVLGVWTGANYGSIATYYGLVRYLENMGLSCLMIDKPIISKNDKEVSEDNHARKFAKENLHISRRYKISDLQILNNYCDMFIVGSDQVWNYGVCRNFGRSFLMDFVRDEKKKVAIASSFGHAKDFRTDKERIITSAYLNRFDFISVREDTAVKILNSVFGVEATQVLDPVFLVDRSVYDKVAEKTFFTEKDSYILCYILDPTPEKNEAIHYVSEKLGLKPIYILDGIPWKYDENKRKIEKEDKIIENVQFPEWILYFKNADYVITDSCHGMSFAIIYQKSFIAIGNENRGLTRFVSLARLLNLQSRLVFNVKDIIDRDDLLRCIDYNNVNAILKRERLSTGDWIRQALVSPKEIMLDTVYPLSTNPVNSEQFDKMTTPSLSKIKRTLPRRLYRNLPISIQIKIRVFAKRCIQRW